MHGMKFTQKIGYALIRGGLKLAGKLPGDVVDNFNPQGLFSADLYRKGQLIKRFHGHNGITIVGKNRILDTMFGKGTPVTQIDPWYIGLINNTPSPVLVEADTLASHSGWSEFTGYSGNRKEWDDADASAKVKSTTTVSTFTFTSGGTAYGIFIASVDTGTSGILWSSGAFDETVTFVTSDELKVSYGLRT